MKKSSIIVTALMAILVVGNFSQPVLAQERGERPERGQRGERGERGERGDDRGGRGPGNFNREDFMQRMVDRMRERYEFSEAEWKVIGPKFTALMTMNMENRTGGGFNLFGGGRRGGPGGRGGDTGGDDSARDVLRKALESNASASAIKEKLAAFRAEKEAQAAKVKKAQDELRQLLTVKQEAYAVIDGLLP